MDSIRSQARWAGLLYVMMGTVAPFTNLYVPNRLMVPGDALATADRVRSLEGLLRAAMGLELSGVTLQLFAALALYELFKRVDQRVAGVMAAMMLVSVPISYANVLNRLAPLVLLKNPAIAAVLDPGQIAAQVTMFLRLHNYGLIVNQIFWGLWLLPIGVLIIRSGFFPRWLAWALFAAGAGYVLNSLGELLLPPSLRWTTEYLQVLGVGELLFFTFYMLIWGVRGCAVDSAVAFLVVALAALGVGSFALLMGSRIDEYQYAAILLAKLAIAVALVMRWRRLESSTRAAVAQT